VATDQDQFPGRSLSPPSGGGGAVVAVVVGTIGIVVGTVVGIVVGIVVAAVVVPPEDAVVVGLTLPPVDSSRPAGIVNGSLDPANDTGGSVSRGVGDGERVGGAVPTPVVPVAPGGPVGRARSSPPSGPSAMKDTMSSRGSAAPCDQQDPLVSGGELHG
jgi:hypothetical protein